MNRLQHGVTAFHQSFDHPAPVFPVTELTPAIAALLRDRAKWLHEEADELTEAVENLDLIGAIDALGDSAYFAVGGFTVLGLDMDPFWDNIQSANMAKLGPDGKPVPHPTIPNKIGKPEGWVPPEALHRETLDELFAEMRVEVLARQIAFLRTQTTETEISFDGPASELVKAVDRARQIFDGGREYAEKMYVTVVKERPIYPVEDWLTGDDLQVARAAGDA